MSSDEIARSTDPSKPNTAPETVKKAPFQFRNRSSATVNEPEVGSADASVAQDADPPEASSELTESSSNGGAVARRLAPVGVLTWLLLAVSLVAAVTALSLWRSADHDPDRDRAGLRDRALIEGIADVETMTSMDHRDVAAGVKAWQDVSTGVLHDQLASVDKDDQQLLAGQGKIATGRVVDAALTELTDRTATLITAVEVTVREDDKTKEPAVKRNRFTADLVLVSGKWKIENLQQVSVKVS